MKSYSKKNLLALCALVILFFSACNTCDPNCNKEGIAMLQLLKERKIDIKTLKTILDRNDQNWTNDSGRICTDCDTMNYCGISLAELKSNMTLYRDNIWSSLSNGSVISHSTAPFTNTKYSGSDNLDARFMEVPYNTLMNYLCFVQTRAQQKLGDRVSSVRLYYIKYPGAINSNFGGNPYAGCHSLAFVPVLQSSGTDYIDTLASTIYDPAKCRVSTAENHNIICPPMQTCIGNTLVSAVDQ